MKTSHIFWGILFIGLGLLILINNFSTLFMDWATIWKLWPLVVVLLGISLLVKHKYGKSFLGGLAAIILALAIFASFKTASHFFHNDFEIVFDDDGDYVFEKTEYSEEFDSTLQFATLNFDAGAGSFNISKVTENLFDATAEGKKDLFRLKRFDHDSTSKIDFDMHGRQIITFGSKGYKNKVDMKLNPQLIWNLTFDVGAASMDFDLSEFKIKSVDVDMGAASINLKLGENYPETKVTIDAGASDVDMFVPEGSGCRIITDGALSSKHFDDFEKLKSDHYETAKFEEAENKIYIEIDSGVSSISVKRY
jgi:hypothetical protein